jgi:hypothetical protein
MSMKAHQFTRLPLEAVAEVFHRDLVERFSLEGQVAPKRRLPRPGVPYPTYNMPDSAYMTGIWLGTLAHRWRATTDAEARARAARAIRALDLLQAASGVEGLLARAAVMPGPPHHDDGRWRPSPDGKLLWRGDVSSDQMCGVYYGYALAFDAVADDQEKELIARNVRSLTERLARDGWRIIDSDGTPTTWGNYTPQYCANREPMNALLLLQHLTVANHVTGDRKFAEWRDEMIERHGYLDLARRARRMGDPTIPGNVNHSDDVLLLLAFEPLLRLEKDAVRRSAYIDGLKRMWEGDEGFPGVAIEANPPATFLHRLFVDPSADIAAAPEALRLFPLDMKWNGDTVRAYAERFGFSYDPTPVSPPALPGQVVPIDRRPKSWSAWVHDPYIAGDRTEDAAQEFNGHDFLWAYWLGRSGGLIGEAC